jgi:hypothetical protein
VTISGIGLSWAAAEGLEIPLWEESMDHVSQTFPLFDEIYEARLDDAEPGTDLILGRPLVAVDPHTLSMVGGSIPESLFAGFMAKVTSSDEPSDVLTVSGQITNHLAGGGMDGPHFVVSRDLDLYRMAGSFSAVIAFATSESYPIDKLLAARVKMAGFGARVSVLVGNSDTEQWWVSDVESTRAEAGEGVEFLHLSQSQWRALDPEKIEPGDFGVPESFDRIGLLMQQGLNAEETLERRHLGNTGFTAFFVRIAE